VSSFRERRVGSEGRIQDKWASKSTRLPIGQGWVVSHIPRSRVVH